jgi:hypothetical protein
MIPADGVVQAAQRWLQVLNRSSYQQALSLLRSGAWYADLTPTQYATAVDWLVEMGLLEVRDGDLVLAHQARGLSTAQANQLLFGHGLEQAAPPWLSAADSLVATVSDLPEDARHLARVLQVPDEIALTTIRQVHGHIDLAERTRVGALGELGLLRLLERRWPGATVHVSISNDGFGYDLVVALVDATWLIEVKSTSRRGRLIVHLTRQEHAVGLSDPRWRMVVVGLDEGDEVAALATVRSDVLRDRAPRDVHAGAAWEAARYELVAGDLEAGLPFLGAPTSVDRETLIFRGSETFPSRFAWMPVR